MKIDHTLPTESLIYLRYVAYSVNIDANFRTENVNSKVCPDTICIIDSLSFISIDGAISAV
jgi:hypothetical protein